MTAAGSDRIRAGERGFSLVEMSMVAIVLVVMSAVIAQAIRGLTSAQTSMRSQTRVNSLAERIASLVEADASYAVRVFGDNDYGRAYLARLDLASILRGSSMLAGSRMPTATMVGSFEHDPAGTNETGNLLLLVRKEKSVTVDISADASGDLRRADTFRFVAWYLHTGPETGVDLARWSSGLVARRADVLAVADPASQQRLVSGLVALGVSYAWDPASAADVAFVHCRADGTVQPMVAGELLPPDRAASEAGILATRHVGIASNATAGAQVPLFANASGDFPGGFEVKRDGDGSGDLLLVRLVVVNGGRLRREFAVGTSMRQVSFRQE
ncbi:MAG: hypothetical protein R3F56_01670 [Planctomycetota bacterium]